MFNFKEAKRRAIEAREKADRGEMHELELKYHLSVILEQIEDAFLTGHHFKSVKIKTEDGKTVSALWIDEDPPQKNKTVDVQRVVGRGNIAYNTEMFML